MSNDPFSWDKKRSFYIWNKLQNEFSDLNKAFINIGNRAEVCAIKTNSFIGEIETYPPLHYVLWFKVSTTFNLKVNCNFQLVTLFRVIGPWIFCTINATNYPIRRKNCVVIFSTHLGTYIEIIARTWQLQSGLQSGFFPEIWRQIYYVILFLTYLPLTLVQEVLYIRKSGSVME